MLTKDLFRKVLIEPAQKGGNKLFIVAAYATPAMAFHHLQTLKEEGLSVDVQLILGMCATEGLGESHHLGFKQLVEKDFKNHLKCSYLINEPPVHAKTYAWFRGDDPLAGFAGSPNYTQTAFSERQREFVMECPAEDCRRYFDSLIDDTIYCEHQDADQKIIIYNDKLYWQRQRRRRISEDQTPPQKEIAAEGLPQVTIPLTDAKGNLPPRSGLNWGQRPEEGREPNQAYIRVPSQIAKSRFFPPKKQHFTVITDDGAVLICTIAQENDKAIETPHNNSLIGRYFRQRLGVPLGQPVTVQDMKAYGRTDVRFVKIDDETYYMDFSKP